LKTPVKNQQGEARNGDPIEHMHQYPAIKEMIQQFGSHRLFPRVTIHCTKRFDTIYQIGTETRREALFKKKTTLKDMGWLARSLKS
jgi:hypothetical protein